MQINSFCWWEENSDSFSVLGSKVAVQNRAFFYATDDVLEQHSLDQGFSVIAYLSSHDRNRLPCQQQNLFKMLGDPHSYLSRCGQHTMF